MILVYACLLRFQLSLKLERGNTEDSNNQMAHGGIPEESLSGSTEKRDMKTVVERMELTSMSVTQVDWQFNGITYLNSL